MKQLEANWYQSELDMIKSFTDEQTKLYEDARKRNMRSFLLMEETAKTQFENIPAGLTLRAKVQAEEEMLRALRDAYEGQKAALEAQDEAEKEMLETQIKILEERQESIGLLDTEEQLLWTLRDQYNAIGPESPALETMAQGAGGAGLQLCVQRGTQNHCLCSGADNDLYFWHLCQGVHSLGLREP